MNWSFYAAKLMYFAFSPALLTLVSYSYVTPAKKYKTSAWKETGQGALVVVVGLIRAVMGVSLVAVFMQRDWM